METARINNLNFTSRCKAVKAGQHTCSILAKNFPAVSSTSAFLRAEVLRDKHSLPPKINIYLQKLKDRISSQRYEYSFGMFQDRSYRLMETVKDRRIADCGERANIANIILMQNGYNSRKAILVADNKDGVGHEICCFNIDNTFPKEVSSKTIIVDPWLGICDFASEVFVRYKNEFGNIFSRIQGVKDKNINEVKFNIESPSGNEYIPSNKELENIRKIMPKYGFPAELKGAYCRK